MVFRTVVFEYLFLPVNVRIVVGMSTVSKSLQLIIVVHRCQTIVDTRLVQSISVGRSIYKISHFWIERELMIVRYRNLTSLHTTLGLHQDSTVHALIA